MFTQLNPFAMRGVEFLIFYSLVLAVTIAAGLLARWWCKQSSAAGSASLVPPTLDPYETAYLAGGVAHVWLLASTKLIERGQIQPGQDRSLSPVRPTGWSSSSNQPHVRSAHPIELLLHQAGTSIDRLSPRLLAGPCETLRATLVSEGLLLGTGQVPLYRFIVSMPFVLTVSLGVARIIQGAINEKPVRYLIGLLIVTFIAWYLFSSRPPRRTAEGERLLAQLKSQMPRTELYSSDTTPQTAIAFGAHPHLAAAAGQTASPSANPTPIGSDAALLIALWGLPVLAGHPHYTALQQSIAPLNSSTGSHACSSSSCSSSSGGGGSSCGGGGGCGGGD
jgi:uncharacterized protein (TIGR04222 family)